MELAFNAYLIGALGGDDDAEKKLKQHATAENVIAEYCLGIFCEHQKNWQEAKGWYEKASQKGHAQATYKLGCLYKEDRNSSQDEKTVIIEKNISQELRYYRQAAEGYCKFALDSLNEMSESEPKAAMHLAQIYELDGEGPSKKNITRAIVYFKKASKLGDKNASFHLGQLYEEEKQLENKVTPQEEITRTACQYYLLATKQKHEQALVKSEQLLTRLQDKKLYFEMGEIWQNTLLNSMLALEWYKKSADQGYKKAIDSLDEIARSDYHLAHDIGQAYESDYKSKHAIKTACEYYFIAAKKRYQPSLSALERLLEHSKEGSLLYRLAEIYQENQQTQLAVKWYLRAIVQNYDQAQLQLQQIARSNANFAYTVAYFYEKGEYIVKNRSVAFIYYAVAARQGHTVSEKHLIYVAKAGNVYAQYALGYEYYHYKKDISQATYWCMQAVEQNHQKAYQYLTQTSFNSVTYLDIASRYERGDGVRQNMQLAAHFYMKADSIGDLKAAYCLGNIYKEDHLDLKKDINKAVTYYFKAAKQGHSQSLSALEKLLHGFTNGQWLYELAEIYRQSGQTQQAIQWYVRAAEQNFHSAQKRLQGISHGNPKFAYDIGQYYEKSEDDIKNRSVAFSYYAIGACQKHQASIERLNTAAKAGSANAQYQLGFGYYHHKKNTSNAIHWCMQAAEQDHRLAMDYLTKTPFNNAVCRMIARRYEDGDGVGVDMQRAILFYNKACDGRDKQAAYCLAQIYESGDEAIEQNIEKAYEYYVLAHQHGHKDALVSLERLGDEVGEHKQSQLSALYFSMDNKNKASFWQSQADEARATKSAVGGRDKSYQLAM